MSLIANDSGGGDFELAPPGTHRAVCYSVVDLGTQDGPYGLQRQVLLTWELTDALMSDSRPFSVSQFYKMNLSERANLRKDLEKWRGKEFTPDELAGFDVSKILGAPCLLTIAHKTKPDGRTSVRVTGVTALPKSMERPVQFNPAICFDIDESSAGTDIEKLPEWVQDKVCNSEEWKARHKPSSSPDSSASYGITSATEDPNDDIPF